MSDIVVGSGAKVVLMSCEFTGVQRAEEGVFKLPADNALNEGMACRTVRETCTYLNSIVRKDRREYEEYMVEAQIDTERMVLTYVLYLKHTADMDFFSDQTVEQSKKLLKSSLEMAAEVLHDYGGEVHQAHISVASHTSYENGKHRYVLGTEDEVRLTRRLIDLYSRAKNIETLHLSVAGELIELPISRGYNAASEADEEASIVGMVLSVNDSNNKVLICEVETGKNRTYYFSDEQRSELIDFQASRRNVKFSYLPSIKSFHGEQIEEGGSIKSFYCVDEDLI